MHLHMVAISSPQLDFMFSEGLDLVLQSIVHPIIFFYEADSALALAVLPGNQGSSPSTHIADHHCL